MGLEEGYSDGDVISVEINAHSGFINIYKNSRFVYQFDSLKTHPAIAAGPALTAALPSGAAAALSSSSSTSASASASASGTSASGTSTGTGAVVNKDGESSRVELVRGRRVLGNVNTLLGVRAFVMLRSTNENYSSVSGSILCTSLQPLFVIS